MRETRRTTEAGKMALVMCTDKMLNFLWKDDRSLGGLARGNKGEGKNTDVSSALKFYPKDLQSWFIGFWIVSAPTDGALTLQLCREIVTRSLKSV